jgi:hypothetical protein
MPSPSSTSDVPAVEPPRPRPGQVRLRTIALPIEHGAWGFWLEPSLLGLLLAPSGGGAALVAAALAAVLLQTPLSIALTDRRRGRRYPRTALAWRWATGYGLVALAAVALAVAATGSLVILLPAALAAPLAGLQLAYDVRGRARELTPELSGAVAMGALASCVALAGGWGLGSALLLWLLLALRTVPSILYVRARLRLERGEAASVGATHLAHGVVLIALTSVAALGLVPPVVVLPHGLLALRAWHGLSGFRRPVSAKVIGFREMAFGLVVVALLALVLR